MSQSPTRLLAIDPGERVGWATAEYVPETEDIGPDRAGFFLLDHGIHSLQPFALKLGKSIDRYDIVIYETWRLAAGVAKKMVGSDMPTCQLIGMIRYLGWASDIELVDQSPSKKKTADKTAEGVFKELIEREPSVHDDAHDIDAVRHLWYWYWNKYVKEALSGKQARSI